MRGTMHLAVFVAAEVAYSLAWVVLRRHRPFRLPVDETDVRYAADRKAAKRAASWYASTVAAAIATLGSLPFVVEFAASRDLAKVQRREAFSEALLVAFIAYLVWDLIMGTRHRYLTALAGYLHHTGYILMLSVILYRGGLSYLFALCSLMELPTFVLGLGFLFPSQRRDDLFLATFAGTRLIGHAAMLAFLTSPYGRTHAGFPGESTLLPAAMLSTSVPLHIYWFASGLAARNRAKRASKVVAAAATPATIVPTPQVTVPPASPPPPTIPADTALAPLVRPRSPRPAPSLRASLPRPTFVPLRMRAGFGGMAIIRDRRSAWMGPRGATARAY